MDVHILDKGLRFVRKTFIFSFYDLFNASWERFGALALCRIKGPGSPPRHLE